jgi:hypothetical protein
MAGESKRVALLVFLFFIFIFLAVIIFVFMYGTYLKSSNYSEAETKSSVECIGYSFRIIDGTISYENGTLSFVFEPLGGAGGKNPLIISSENKEVETQPVDFSFKQKIRMEMPPLDSFNVSPKGCGDIIKKCDVAKNRCGQ